jgi:hypothetical protein
MTAVEFKAYISKKIPNFFRFCSGNPSMTVNKMLEILHTESLCNSSYGFNINTKLDSDRFTDYLDNLKISVDMNYKRIEAIY